MGCQAGSHDAGTRKSSTNLRMKDTKTHSPAPAAERSGSERGEDERSAAVGTDREVADRPTPEVFARSKGLSRFLGNVAALLTANVYSQCVAVFSGIMIARWIAPADYGVWVALNILPAYVSWVQFGTSNGLGRELPVKIGECDENGAQDLVGTAVGFNAVAGLVGAALIPIVAVVLNPIVHGPTWRSGLVVIAATSSLNTFGAVLFMIARSYRYFSKTAVLTGIQASLNLLGLLLIRSHGIYGLFARALIVNVFLIGGYIVITRKHLTAVRLRLSALRSLLRVGIPLFVAGYLAQLTSVADRTLVSRFLSPEALGAYGLATFLFSAVTGLGSNVTIVTFPELAELFGRYGTVSYLWPCMLRHVKLVLFFLGVPVALLWLLLPDLVRLLAPRYVSCVPPGRILLISAVISCCGSAGANVLNAIGACWHTASIECASLVTIWVLASLFLSNGYGSTGAAYANLIAAVVYVLGVAVVLAHGCRRVPVRQTLQ